MEKKGKGTSLRLSSKTNKLIPSDISESLGKLPPQALDLEETLLAAIMLEKHVILQIADVLKPEHFYDDKHKAVYEAIMDLFRKSEPIDMRTVVNQLRSNGTIELVGGAYYIAQLTTNASSSANMEYYARVVQEKHLKRQLINYSNVIHHDAYDDTTDVFELLERADRMMEELTDGSISNQSEKHVKVLAVKNVENIQQRMQGVSAGIPSGFKAIDRITHGWQITDLIILGARPGMGKTAFVTQACYNISNDGKPVGMFELEMPGIQVVERTAISITEIDPDKIRNGTLNPIELDLWISANGKLSALPWYIDDTAGLNIIELRARARRMKVKYNIQFLVVDYLQLINGRLFDGMNRDQEIGLITRTLKQIAKELEIPVLAISSLGRSCETRGGDRRPQLQDLRESGNIESDADVVMFLYRAEYYKITVDEDGMPTHGVAEAIFAKHRNGALGTAKLRFVGKHTKFFDMDAAGYTIVPEESKTLPRGGVVHRGYKDPLPNEERNPLPETNDDTPF